jgi:LacI family transcriptional regulator
VTSDPAGPTPATIYDVAARAGVSITTVSLALNRPGRVAEGTRRKVLTAVDELSFVPKAAAVAQARRGVGLVGIIAPFSAYPSYGLRLSGVLRVLQGRAIEVVIYDEESAAAAASPLLSSLPIRRRLDGLIIMGLPIEDKTAERLHRQRLPTVLIDTTAAHFTSVVCDDEYGGYLAGQHLTTRGHRQLAFVSERLRSPVFVSQGERRLRGFRRAVAETGGDPDGVIVLRIDNSLGGGRDATRQLLDGPAATTAVFAHHDLLACGILMELRDRGLRPPGDLAVVGFDNGTLAEFAGLTTISQPLEDSGRVAAESLLRAIEHPDAPVHTTSLDLELVHRETT